MNFEQITTERVESWQWVTVVFVTAKVMNFEQITTNSMASVWSWRCLCHRKGNEFWANHNWRVSKKPLPLVVFVTAKVMNFEQITTVGTISFASNGCLCHRKGNEFWANHNIVCCIMLYVFVVFVTAKVMNFEQITTCRPWFRWRCRCLCHRKGNEFWANHNISWKTHRKQYVVFVTAKVMNYEQITTLVCSHNTFSSR